MKHTHGNCKHFTEESETHVYCRKDYPPGCWYSRCGDARKCRFWTPRVNELHLRMVEVVGEYYRDGKDPLAVIARCDDGKSYLVQPSHLAQARAAGWTCAVYAYTEDDVAYTRKIWTDPQKRAGIPIIVIADSEVKRR